MMTLVADVFTRNGVRAVLKLWHSSGKLGAHALAQNPLVLRIRTEKGYADSATGRGVALRDLLRECIESLKPDGAVSYGEKRWRPYLILLEQYVNGRKPEYLAEQFGLVRGSFHQEQAAALERLGDALRERLGAALPPDDTPMHEVSGSTSTRNVAHPVFLAPTRPLTPLIGREQTLAAAKHVLCHPQALPVALFGIPGSGKTALAVELANDPGVLAHFADGVLWAGLGTAPDLLGALGLWAQALGLSRDDIARLNTIDARAKALHSVIGLKRILLVIDDVWHLEQAQTFQIGGPNCAHLFTTRQPALAYALAGEQAIQAHELDASTGAELLSSHAPGIVERHPEAVKQLVGAVGGLPLALSLMGRRLRSAALGNQTRRIAQTVQALVDEFGGHDGKPLAEVIALSEARLSSAERKALHALAVFPPKPASFTEAAAVAAADCDIALIDTLVDAGLVESMGERLRLHQTIADHARAALKHPEAVIERALAHYYGELLQNQAARDTGFASEEVAVAMALIDLAQGQALHGSAERCAALLAPLLIQRGQLDAAERILHQALMRPSAQDVPTSAMLHLARGRVAQRRGQFDIARAQFTAAEQALAGAVSDPAAACLQADVLLAQATLANDRGDREQADALGQRALAQARPLDDARLLSAILTQLAAAAGFRAQFPESEAYLLEARGFAERAGDQRAEALLSLGLGLIDSWLGNVADGEADFAHSYALAKASDAREIASIVRSMQGWVCANLGDYPRAISHSEESLALIREGGFCESAGLAYTNLGFIAMNQGRIDEAERLVEKGSAVVRQIGHKEGECMMYNSRARIACERGDWAYAERQAREGIQHCDALDYWELMPSLMATLGEALTMQGQYDDADGFLMTSLMLAHNMQRPWLQAYAYAVWGGCYLIREEVDRAQDMFDEALRIAERLGARPYAALALFGLARVAALRNDVVGAQALGKRALATFEEIGHVHAQHVRSWLASMQGV